MTKLVSDDQTENEVHANIEAKLKNKQLNNIVAEEKRRHGKKFMRCISCGQTGWSGEYPFSTCPPVCDDCN